MPILKESMMKKVIPSVFKKMWLEEGMEDNTKGNIYFKSRSENFLKYFENSKQALN